jgi:hypothetical protein
MNKSFLFFSLLVILALHSCDSGVKGAGDTQPETRSVSPFTEIVSDNSIDITFRQIQEGVDKVVVTAQENLLPMIITKVKNGTLHISTEGSYQSDQELKIDIYGRHLNSLTLNSSGDFNSDGRIDEQKFYLEMNSSGDADIRLKSKSIEVDSNGSGDISMAGTTDYLEVELNSSGDFSALELRTFNTELELNGSGDAKVFAKESLEIELNGSGDVSYKGRAKIEKTINGSGEVFEL